jgi:hypothetical protein
MAGNEAPSGDLKGEKMSAEKKERTCGDCLNWLPRNGRCELDKDSPDRGAKSAAACDLYFEGIIDHDLNIVFCPLNGRPCNGHSCPCWDWDTCKCTVCPGIPPQADIVFSLAPSAG